MEESLPRAAYDSIIPIQVCLNSFFLYLGGGRGRKEKGCSQGK